MEVPASMKVTDDRARAVQKTPNRVSIAEIQQHVQHVDYLNPARHPHMTICLVTLDNGWVLIGDSTPADPDNFDVDKGKEFALEQALKKAWPLYGFLLRERLARGMDAAGGEQQDG